MVTANKDFTQVEPDWLEDDISEKAQQVWQPRRFNTKQLTEGQYNTDKKLACFKFQNTNNERLTKVTAVIHDVTACYKLTYYKPERHTVHISLAKF
jgi:hypothetical protein